MVGKYGYDQQESTERRKKLLPGTVILVGAFLTCHCGWAMPVVAREAKPVSVDYNPNFIHGSGVDVSRFSDSNPVSPGTYDVRIWVNGELRGKESVRFVIPPNQSGGEACLTRDQIKRIGIRVTESGETETVADCALIEEWIAQSSSHYNSGDFELSIQVPQLNLVVLPRGYIDSSLWQVGETVGFLDYSGNVYSLFQGADDGREANNTYNGNLGLSTGFNYQGWRLRKRISSNWNTGSSPQTQNLYGYAAHDVTALKSELLLGETNTKGDLFDSYGIRGVVLQSEDRMLPDSLRVYTPVLRGIAETNAKVMVMQRGLTIYETVVPPGPFELSDIGTMGYGGDLLLVVTEADGRQRRQNIPFSAPPLLLHEGISNFSLSAGQLKDEAVNGHPSILQGTYRYGLFNKWTLYGGGLVGEKYRALAAGNAINTPLGGVSFDVTHAQSELRDAEHASGNSYQVNFTKYLGSTDTNLTLAAYRFSSSGFYTFREASQARMGKPDDRYSSDFRTRHRFTATVSQRIEDSMSLYFSGSLYTYWGDRDDSRQYSMTFNHALPKFSYGLTAMRTQNEGGRDENSLLLSFNLPLGRQTTNHKPLFSSLYSSASHSNRGNTQFQTLANGSQGEQSELTYGIGGTAGNFDEGQRDRTLTGNVNYQSGVGQFGATVSANNHYAQQLSVSASGSVVGHRGGVTAGPTIGDAPFAIIGAQGAKGARLLNGYGGKVDGNGYAIMPSLTPYRENQVSLDARGLPDTVDVLENEKTIVPRQGAAIAVDMRTITGAPMVLILRDMQREFLPIGSDLLDEDGSSQGVVGQGGQAFVRGWQADKHPLYADVGEQKLRCVPMVAAVQVQATQITRLEVTCSRIGN
ncbi:fimbria/pilus outer membrane usher protein [Serratia inhibens]|uniref:fimbria/pilus outer membrane usher protein n=1 Tax=Serratia inhibens TaxID=2338073 RepID=UPI00025E39A0|nr:fimbria/pilus outer membrane usher protein [Serratia inhibens]ANS44532.1 Outer membrane usher protein HtrE [Serratia inhibens PRI-2C]